METPSAIRDTRYVPDLYFIFQHEKLGTFKVVQKLQDLYRAGELTPGLGDAARLLLTFDQRRALRYTARERLIAFRKVLGYNLLFRPSREPQERNRAFQRLLAALAMAIEAGSGIEKAEAALLANLAPLFDWDLAPLCAEVLGPLDEALRIFMSPELCAELGAGSGTELVEMVLRRYFAEQQPQVQSRSRLAESGRLLLRELGATPREVAQVWLSSAAGLEVLPTRSQPG